MRALLILVLGLPLLGCSEDDPPPSDASSICEKFATPYDAYVAGLTKSGENGLVQVSLEDASPAPPAKGDNRWVVKLLDTGDAPMPDATVANVKPFMPDHGHGTTVLPAIGDTDADGEVTIDDIDFAMAGVWTVTLEVDTTSGLDRAVFAFCIDG